MILIRILFLLLIAVFIKSLMYQYEFVPNDEAFLEPCDIEDTISGDEYFCGTKLSVKRLDEQSIQVQGIFEISEKLPNQTILKVLTRTLQMQAHIYKKSRGIWQNTVFHIYREDFCKAVFDPADFWHDYVDSIPKEQRICPLFPGQKFDVNGTTDFKLSFPDYSLEGEYKIVLMLTSNTFNETICAMSFYQFYRLR